ncbi:unnamed protein product [Ectocarpus sp. 8 AP-2014]
MNTNPRLRLLLCNECSHPGGTAQAERNGAHERGLSRAVRSHDHVQASPKHGLGVLVHEKVLHLEANDGAFFSARNLAAGGTGAEPMSLSLLVGALLLMLVVTMLLMPLVSWHCLPPALHQPKFEEKRTSPPPSLIT